MVDSSTIGARFEDAARKLFNRIFPLFGFEVIKTEHRISGTQGGYDIRFETKPLDVDGVRVNFFVECKGAKRIETLPPAEFTGKPDQLLKSTFNPDYWILLSPLRYKNNDFQELLETWKKSYPFAFLDWIREAKEDDIAGFYLDLFKHFPDIYEIFKEDVPESIRDTRPEYKLDEILARLKKDLNDAYDEYQNRVVIKGIIPGIRRITQQSVFRAKETDIAKLNKIRTNYYMLNSSDRSVWKTVCNGIDVPNTAFKAEINKAIENDDDSINTIWVLGASGCGKTTQMYRTAVDFAAGEYPVILINSLDLDETTSFADYEKYFKLIHHLHNTSLKEDETKPLLIFIDNPAARIETISHLLSRFDDLDDDKFKCAFILFEREIRYRQAEEDNFLIDIAESHQNKLYIEAENTAFKENVLKSFAKALDLPADESDIAQEAFFEDQHTTVAEGIINFCKRTNNQEYKKIVMDWVDFENIARRQQWNSLTDLYKWTSLLYQFGVALPVSLLDKILNKYDENEFFNLRDFLDNEEYENLPLILEGNTLRTRHELIARWHVDEELKNTFFSRLGKALKAVDVQDTLERSIYIALLGRKNIVKWYLAKLDRQDFEVILKNSAEHPVTQRLALMAQGWIYSSENDLEKAVNVFRSILEIDADYLPAIMETAKTDFLLGNYTEAEQRLQNLLDKRPNDLHTRTELARFYRSQTQFEKSEKLLKECIGISKKDLNARTELAKLYQVQEKHTEAIDTLNDLLKWEPRSIFARNELGKIFRTQKKYADAERVLKECIKISPNDLDSRTELGKVYQALERFEDAEKILLECIDISPRDLNSRTELGKVYQALGRFEDAEKILLDLLNLDKTNLQARTELGKVYQALERFDEAEKRLLEYIELDPKGLQPRTELAKVYQALERFEDAEKILLKCIDISPRDLNSRTELGKVYQALGRFEDAEKILLESITIDDSQLHPRTELARVYIHLKLFRKARAVTVSFLQKKSDTDYRKIDHLFLSYLNACYQMKRYKDGLDFIDKYGCQFLSPQLAEEYGRLLRNYDLKSAVKFFQTASRKFSQSSRLLSEAAICFKLGGSANAESVLKEAIRLEPKKEKKYRDLYDYARFYTPIAFRYSDRRGIIVKIDYEKMNGVLQSENQSYSFRWNERLNLLYAKLKADDEVFFDVTDRNYAMNVEPFF